MDRYFLPNHSEKHTFSLVIFTFERFQTILLLVMATKWKHGDDPLMYFCTFTCYDWLCLFEMVNGYDLVYKWFDAMKPINCHTVGYVIMPNHVHLILYFPEIGYDLNRILGNGKRLIAYEIINRLEKFKQNDTLNYLAEAVSQRERKKRQLHKVFTDSFDAKAIYSERFFNQKLNYIHKNPVRGKWQLVEDYTDYEHSSASYYERGIVRKFVPFDFRLL
jgi:putative transposase